ncbi:kinase-like domain-containing protein, partial [Linnemannia elongata]
QRSSHEGGIMSLESVKHRCIRVFDDGGQSRIVNVHDVMDAGAIYTRVLHKFNITDDMEKYSMFTLGETGDARSLADEELLNICKSLDRPEKERLILRKKHLPVSHDVLKRRGTAKRSGRGGTDLASPTANSFKESSSRMQTFFGQRPPDEIIESNLAEYFPGHRKELLREVSNVRNSLFFRNSQYMSRSSYIPRHSYLIEPGQADVLSQSLAHLSLQEADETDETDEVETPAPSSQSSPSRNQVYGQQSPAQSTVVESSRPNDKQELDEEEEEEEEEETLPAEDGTKNENAVIPLENDYSWWIRGKFIGAGSFARVSLGWHRQHGTFMAVKQVELAVNNSQKEDKQKMLVEALEREIDLLKQLHHERIVQYIGSDIEKGHINIFLEYVPGGSIATLLANYGPFSEVLVRSFVKQILEGLDYLHECDIIHRDIKGANILVDNKGCIKISDFGISKKVEEHLKSIQVKSSRPSLQGSTFWMAPEVVKQIETTYKADIWSLGCLVVEMFTGTHPFPQFSQMQALFQIGSNCTPDIPEDISDDAKDFLKMAFEVDYHIRPSARILLGHLFIQQLS